MAESPPSSEPADPQRPKRVRRGEGELSSWPRGLAAYVPARPEEDARPSEEEDRTAQRIELAGRLIGVLRSRGEEVEGFLRRLASVRERYRSGEGDACDREVDTLLSDLGDRADRHP